MLYSWATYSLSFIIHTFSCESHTYSCHSYSRCSHNDAPLMAKIGTLAWRLGDTRHSAWRVKGRLNTGTSPQNFWKTFLRNVLTEKLKKSAVANAIAIPLPLCFSSFVLLRRFRENLTKPFYFYLSRTCGSSGGTPSVPRLKYICYFVL